MITYAKDANTEELIPATEAQEDAEKGRYLCPFCETPITPVDNKFFRIYPGGEHKLDYCRIISVKEHVYDPAITNEYNFFSNKSRPEPAFQKSKSINGMPLYYKESSSDAEGMQELMGIVSDMDEFPLDDADGEITDTIPAEADVEEKGKKIRGSTLTSLAQIYDQSFHTAPLTAKMFTHTRGYYMLMPENIEAFYKEHGEKIEGFKIIPAVFSGYSLRDQMLLFNVFKEVNSGQYGYQTILFARIEIYCPQEDYYMSAVLPKFTELSQDGRYEYRYKKVHCWLSTKWTFTPASKCTTCKYRQIHKNIACGSCVGLLSGRIDTTRNILFTCWQNKSTDMWEKRMEFSSNEP